MNDSSSRPAVTASSAAPGSIAGGPAQPNSTAKAPAPASPIINGIALSFSLAFLIAAGLAAWYTGEVGSVLRGWYLILVTPTPLVTDYFAIGGLSSALLNAGACGLACFAFMVCLKGDSHVNTLAGFFLVIAHCFYGLNFLNMWPCFLAPFLFLRLKKLDFKGNLHICMFATSFAPFISELLFRYNRHGSYVFGKPEVTLSGIVLALIFAVFIGFVVPVILPGVKTWHKGYNLYNGGLAFGLLGFFLYNFMYKTMCLPGVRAVSQTNEIYRSFEHNYVHFATLFFGLLFSCCIAAGFFLNQKSFRGYGKLLKDTGYSSDFSTKYGMPLCLVNIGLCGLIFLLYLNIITRVTEGAGFTGPTMGVILASLTFTSMGQHPKNVWPIIFGYQLLYYVTVIACAVHGRELSWSISTQSYINGVAFATGLCPITGRFGVRAGILAGFFCASMCTATSALHGGLVLYNGGFTAGITALILLPILEYYFPAPRTQMKEQNLQAVIAIIDHSSGKDSGL